MNNVIRMAAPSVDAQAAASTFARRKRRRRTVVVLNALALPATDLTFASSSPKLPPFRGD